MLIEIAIAIAIGIRAIGESFNKDPDFDFEGSMVLHGKNLTHWQRSLPLKDL